MTRLVVRNGTVVSPEFGTLDADVVIEGGLISGLTRRGLAHIDGETEVLEAEGRHVFPGFVDPHMHLGNYRSFEQDCISETRAAAAGGVTTVISYCKSARMRTPDAPYDHILNEASTIVDELSSVDVAFHVAIGRPDHVTEIASLVKKGFVSFKFYMAYRGDQRAIARGTVGLDDAELLAGIRAVGAAGPSAIAAVHCENSDICQVAPHSLEAREMSFQDWEQSRPPIAESEAIARAIRFSAKAGARLYVVHLSSTEGLEVVERARSLDRSRVHVEVTPHYLLLDSDFCSALPNPAIAKTCPPIRASENREGLWRALEEGLIDTIGSDHCAFESDKKRDLLSADAGFASVDLYPSLVIGEAVRRAVPLERVADATSRRPAQIFGLYPQKGSLRPGADADLAIFDLTRTWTVRADQTESAAKQSPYDGWQARAYLETTILRGETVYRNGTVNAGMGRSLQRTQSVS